MGMVIATCSVDHRGRVQAHLAPGASDAHRQGRKIKPQSRLMATAQGITCVEVDCDQLRGASEPDLTLS